MWKRLFIAVIVVLLLIPVRASADAEQDCEKGMAMLKAEHPKAVRDQLQKVLKDAQKEDEDGDWDECVDAVKAGTRALGK